MVESNDKWYQTLVDECESIITETTFVSRWALVEGYHQLGARILEEHDNFERKAIYGQNIAKRVAKSLGKSETTIKYAVRFAKKIPDLNMLPEGKDLSWSKVVNKYLASPDEKKEKQKPVHKCPECGCRFV